MKPKTFEVALRPDKKSGGAFDLRYRIFLHADSKEDAFRWVADTFPSVDLQPTLLRWARPVGSAARIGNDDPVVIVDRDDYRRAQWTNGRRVAVPYPAGELRRSEVEVAGSLFDTLVRLREDEDRLRRSFEQFTVSYTRHGRQLEYERMLQIRGFLHWLPQWQERVWISYLKARPACLPSMPVYRQAA